MKINDYSLVDLTAEYCFTGKTQEENSLVCITGNVPPNAHLRGGAGEPQPFFQIGRASCRERV